MKNKRTKQVEKIDTSDEKTLLSDVMVELHDYELNFCSKCLQMTNQLNGVCQKCKDN